MKTNKSELKGTEQKRSNHTPTPWKVKYAREIYGGESFGRFISTTESRNVMPHITVEDSANAEFIVRAVNSHEVMLEALKTARERFVREGMATANIDEAIAQAEGK